MFHDVYCLKRIALPMFTAQPIFKWYRHTETLFRRRVLRCLPICPSKMTLGLYGLNITPIHVPASVFLGQRQTVQTHSQIRHRIVLFSVISIFTVCLQNARTRYYELSKSYSQTKNNNTSTPYPFPPPPPPPPQKKKKKKTPKNKTKKKNKKKTHKKTLNPQSVQCTPRFL